MCHRFPPCCRLARTSECGISNQFLDVSIPLFVYGLYRVVRLRRREGTRDGTAALAVLVGVITILMLMREWPYRTFNHRDFERADFDGARCY